MIYRVLFAICSCILISISGNSQKIDWVSHIGSSDYDRAWRMTEDMGGSIYLSAVFSDTLKTLAGTTNKKTARGLTDAAIIKYNSQGHISWVYQIGGVGNEFAYDIQSDQYNNVYLLGIFSDSVDFDEGIGVSGYGTAATGYDIFLLKIDSAGSFQWVKTLGEFGDDRGLGLAIDGNGNIFLTGMFSGTVDLDPGAGIVQHTSAGSMDFYVMMLDSSGAYQWSHSFGNTWSDIGQAIALDTSGNCVITGGFRGTVDFDPGPNVSNLTSVSSTYDAYIAKYDLNGNFIWAKRVGHSGSDRGYDVAINDDSEIVITGNFFGTVNFNPGGTTRNLTSNGGSDSFIAKFDHNGSNIWAISIGDSLIDQGFSIDVDEVGFIYASGYFSGRSDFDPGIGNFNIQSKGGRDGYLVKLNSQGGFEWMSQQGSVGEERSYGVFVSKTKEVYVAGDFEDTVRFTVDTTFRTLVQEGGTDAFLLKIVQCNLKLSKDTLIGCDSIRAPSGNFVWNNSGSYFDTLISRIGCDSIVEYEVSIFPTKWDTIFMRSCDTVYTPTGNKKWISGQYKDTLQSNSGCDSVITVFVTIDTSTSSSINERHCDAYMAPSGKVHFESGFYVDTISNFRGCDSLISIDLKIDTMTFGFISERACYSFTSASGKVWSNTGQYTDTISNSYGCDSVLSYDIIIDSTTFGNVSGTYCFEYKSPSGKLIKSSGQYSDTIFNSKGCDSIVYQDIRIDSVNIKVTNNAHFLTAEADSASYQWMFCDNSIIAAAKNKTYKAKVNGNYKVEIEQKTCIDTSACYTVSSVPIDSERMDYLRVFPNPSNGNVYLRSINHSLLESFEVRSVTGAVFSNGEVNQELIILDLPKAQGVYILKINWVEGKPSFFRIVRN